jgi:hypothetical protein
MSDEWTNGRTDGHFYTTHLISKKNNINITWHQVKVQTDV